MRRVSPLAVLSALLSAGPLIAAAIIGDWQALVVCTSIAGVAAAVLSLREDR